MAAERIDGKAIARMIESELKTQVARFRAEAGRAPGLAVSLRAMNNAAAATRRPPNEKSRICFTREICWSFLRFP